VVEQPQVVQHVQNINYTQVIHTINVFEQQIIVIQEKFVWYFARHQEIRKELAIMNELFDNINNEDEWN